MKTSLAHGPIAHVAQCHRIPLKVFVSKCQPGTQRDLSSDDTVSAVESMFFGEDMHGTAHPFGCSGDLPE